MISDNLEYAYSCWGPANDLEIQDFFIIRYDQTGDKQDKQARHK